MVSETPHTRESVDELRQAESAQLTRELRERLMHLGAEDRNLVGRAIALTHTLHRKQKNRIDGTSVLSHVYGVANGVLDINSRADAPTIAAALLHDSLEDRKTLLEYYGRFLDLSLVPEEDYLTRAAEFIKNRLSDGQDSHVDEYIVHLVRNMSEPPFILQFEGEEQGEQKSEPTREEKDAEYLVYVSKLSNPDAPFYIYRALMTIKWADALQNMPLGVLKRLRDDAVREGNEVRAKKLGDKVIKLRSRYKPVIQNIWLPFWEHVTKEPFVSRKEEALAFLHTLLETDYREEERA